MYTLKKISSKTQWNNFVIQSGFEFYSFLQSWEWGEVQKLLKKGIKRYGIYEENKMIGLFQMIEIKAKRGTYYFIPHGPLIKKDFFIVLSNIMPILKAEAKRNKIHFIRLNSTVVNTYENNAEYKKLGFINAPMHEHAEDTHLLNLTTTEDMLLSNIKKKDKYYINRAIKEGVKIRIGNEQDHIQSLINMHHHHSLKTGYHQFSETFIYTLYNVFGDNITTISASYKGSIESILMTIKFGQTCVYYIAASDIKHPKFSPNYLCQWEAIKKAKQDGATSYNFWGISPDNNPKHPIAGVTKFKKKFAGYDYSLLHAQDMVISYKYYFNWIIETIRRLKRGYYYKKPF